MASHILSVLAIITALLSIAAGANLEKRGVCPMHYVTGPNNLCFRFYEDRKNWAQAQARCKAEGGQLANTQSGAAYWFVRQHIEANPVKANIAFGLFGEPTIFTLWDNGWWVGAKRWGPFKWINGQRVQGHWCKQMPDNFFGHEDCLEQMAGNTGWNDRGCHVKLRYICQKKGDPCASVQCGNGKCVANGAKASCACNVGWTGSGCNVVVDPCKVARINCGNGKCVADKMIGGSVRCACSTGWTGDRCNVVVDPCKGVDCNNGKCVADKMIGGKARCQCDDGWTGPHCEAVADLCEKNPCKNGGECVSNHRSPFPNYHCRCVGNFKGKNCEKSCRFEVTKAGFPAKMDAMILFDGSSSLQVGGGDKNRPKDFLSTLGFISEIVDELDVGPEKSRLELAQFSHKFRVELDFASSVKMDLTALRNKIAAIKFLQGATLTGKALEQAYNIFKSQGRKAEDVAKYLFVVTDGTSHDRKSIPAAVANLKRLGVKLVAVGVGKDVDVGELTLIAGGNAADVFSVDSFDQLNGALIAKVVENICE